MNDLADRYRKLLAWYPRDHRVRHGEEMLGVLLAGAGDRDRPSRGETVDLLRGALKLHLRRVVGADGGIDHRDVFAIVSLLGPVVLLAGAIPVVDGLVGHVRLGTPLTRWFLVEYPDAPVWAIWSVVAVLSLCGLRRAAAVGAWAGVVGFVVAAAFGYTWFWTEMVAGAGWTVLGVVVAVALTWSPGPVRGRELVGGRRYAVLVAATGVSAALVLRSLATYNVVYYPIGVMMYDDGVRLGLWFLALAVLVTGAVVAAGARTREGRRAALMLSVPVVASVVMLALPTGSRLMVLLSACYGVPVLLLVGLGGLPRRVRTGRSA